MYRDQKLNMDFWKLFNLMILIIQVILVLTGTLFKQIAFGWGLGDLIWYGLLYLMLIIHLILTIVGWKKSRKYHQKLSLTFFLLIVWICLEATIWRDSEYAWNGKIFHD